MQISARSFILKSLITFAIIEFLLLISKQPTNLLVLVLSGYVVYELVGLVIIYYHNERIKNGEDQEDKE